MQIHWRNTFWTCCNRVLFLLPLPPFTVAEYLQDVQCCGNFKLWRQIWDFAPPKTRLFFWLVPRSIILNKMRKTHPTSTNQREHALPYEYNCTYNTSPVPIINHVCNHPFLPRYRSCSQRICFRTFSTTVCRLPKTIVVSTWNGTLRFFQRGRKSRT